jgi:predicted ATPase
MLITGAPGVGKSRVRHEFMRRLERRPDPLTVLLGRGDLISAGAPYAILGQAIRRFCGLSGSEPQKTQRLCISERIGQHVAAADRERVAVFICELCGLPFPDDEAPLRHAVGKDPKLMADCIRRAFVDWLSAECQTAPVILILDDLQWGDGLTVALAEEALRELQALPLLLLAFARPEVHDVFPRLRQNQRLQEMALKGLSKRACERLIQQVIGKDAAPEPEQVARAIEQAAGNALFLEELSAAPGARLVSIPKPPCPPDSERYGIPCAADSAG